MRFIYTILLGLVVFQGFMLILAPVFPSGATSPFDPVDPTTLKTNPDENETDEPATGYGEVTKIDKVVIGMLSNPIGLAIIGLFAVVGSGVGVFFGGVKNLPLAIGVGLVVGVFANIWNGTYTLISGLAQSNSYVQGIYSLITVCIGIILVILVGEFFMGQTQGVN